jgi:hypothetical protein
MNQLKLAGVGISIDDYGSGLSSLSYLRAIPAEELKIDKVFVENLGKGNSDTFLVKSTIDLAHSLGMKLTAEGVETADVLAILRAMGPRAEVLQAFLALSEAALYGPAALGSASARCSRWRPRRPTRPAIPPRSMRGFWRSTGAWRPARTTKRWSPSPAGSPSRRMRRARRWPSWSGAAQRRRPTTRLPSSAS